VCNSGRMLRLHAAGGRARVVVRVTGVVVGGRWGGPPVWSWRPELRPAHAPGRQSWEPLVVESLGPWG
jgi:hypothetical protein